MGIGAALGASAIGSLISSGIGAFASSGAASTQAGAANQASQIQLAEWQQIQKMLKPYSNVGTTAANTVAALTGLGKGGSPATAPLTETFQAASGQAFPAPFNFSTPYPGNFSFNPTMDQLAQTPGYQFALKQGLQATQNGFAAQGLGTSGAALKGAANYAEGLASTTYQQQFNNALSGYQTNVGNWLNQFNSSLSGYQTNVANYQQQFQNYLAQNQQIYGLLSGQASLGENAAAQAGNTGATVANNIGSTLMGAGQATAAGQVGVANALTGGVNALGTNALTAAVLNPGMFGGSNQGANAGASAGGIYWGNNR